VTAYYVWGPGAPSGAKATTPQIDDEMWAAIKLAKEQLALHAGRREDAYSPVSPVVRRLARALLRATNTD
jgi:hypothetical protein